MALVRYEPWNLLDKFSEELNRLGGLQEQVNRELDGDNSNVVTSHWRPAVDIKEEKDRFVILADLPGVDPKDIEVTMENGVLTLKGERASDKEESHEGYKRVERIRGTFYRRFSLPDTADADRIEATGKNGVLEITLPKSEKGQPRKITVKV
ncbi:MAG TPA: Hsp20/alpha crystallin family protein [Gammaproteobacteria bacterium]|nr:Hsp20/alpha crystallin family protein [Gammaproteobacteria bacterium]